ncbi:phage holin [Marinomonas sp.]|uniref:phage holin n=1 Tax=Marinomonas sp. TaxID=1904862 RepID=UPI003A9454F5
MIDKAAINSYVTSGAVTAFGGLTANEIAAYGGLFFAGATYFTNLYFKIRSVRRVKK